MINPEVICGDCVSIMRSLPSGTVDLVVADPPYNLGKDYGNESDFQARDAYLQFSRDWLNECSRLLKPNGSIFVFMGFRFISHLFCILEDELKFHFNNWICWFYTQGMGRTKGFSPRHDDILFFTKSTDFQFYLDAVRVPQKFYRARNNMRGANPGDVWEFSHVHYCQDSRTDHPTQKPEGLAERMILASTKPGDFVLDPFAGSGTTLRVCQQLERKSVGIELSEDYVALIHRRLALPFTGFDSIDPRMRRIPNDLNDLSIREAYRLNHKKWFLQNHDGDLRDFEADFDAKYSKEKRVKPSLEQSLFGDVQSDY